MANRSGPIPIFALAAVLAACGCTAAPSVSSNGMPGVLTGSTVEPLVEALTQRTVAPLPQARLADGLIPPTNSWFSGLVFGDEPMPVFPLPLSFGLSDEGFAFGLPTITTSPNVIMGGFAGLVSVDVGADSQEVVAYDEASITIAQRSGNSELGRTIVAEGSPFVSFTASAPVTARWGTAFSAVDGAWTTGIGGETYGLVTTGTVSSDGMEVSLQDSQTATWFALAKGGSLAEFVSAAAHPLAGTTIDYSVTGDHATTVIGYPTIDEASTIVAAMPHQYESLTAGQECTAGTYDSIYGELKACIGSHLSWSVSSLAPAASLDLTDVKADDISRIREQLTADLATTPVAPADTYYGGKWLYRLANMLTIARQIGAADLASSIETFLIDALDEWTDADGCEARDSRCFVYDPEAKGVVGLAPSFGSEQFNDHHFHYGYFLYAAGVVAADDAELAERWAPVMNLLAADLATDGESTFFPQRRVFDAYVGHSWASGTAPFADGNNQESSSEAVSAWNGLALWAAASGQTDLHEEASWMLSAEAASALAYYTNSPLDSNPYAGFDHTVTSLNWGGKRDYATWFSPEPSAMLGILVLPMSPVAGYLGVDADRINTNLKEAAPNGFDVLFGDYLLMYSALGSPEAAQQALIASTALNEDRIDDGNSRSYLLAWIMSQGAST